jgi:hypothetical protein
MKMSLKSSIITTKNENTGHYRDAKTGPHSKDAKNAGGGILYTSRTFIIFLIPLIILGLGLWFVASLDVNSGDVQVAGALIRSTEVEMSVNDCYLTETDGTRKLVVEMEGKNTGFSNINLNPGKFQLVLAKSENPVQSQRIVYNPMRYTSTCEDAPASVSSIPPDAVRSVTLVFWGENLPRGDEWEDHLLSLEYLDPSTSLMVSKLINPSEE